MVRFFSRSTTSPSVSPTSNDPHISVSPAAPIDFYPPPRHLLTPPLPGGVNNPQRHPVNCIPVGQRDASKDGLPTISPFTTEDSPSRRRITTHILGHLASPSMSDTPICSDFSPLGTVQSNNRPSNARQNHNYLDVFYPYRNAQPGTIVATAAQSPFVHLQSASVMRASPPAASPMKRDSLMGKILGGDGVGTGTPNRVFVSENEQALPPRALKKRRRRMSQSKSRRSSWASDVSTPGNRATRRPRPHSIDPAGRDIPMRGKKVFTYALTVISIFLVFQSLIAGGGFAPLSVNPMLGPSAETLLDMGGLVTQLVREGEWWRLFWSPFLHAGVFHLVLNIALWLPLGNLTEPDWGAIRTGTIFMVGAFTGNLMSACLDPYTVSVGNSGGVFGVMAAFVPYVIEFWHSIPRAKCLLGLVGITVVVGVATSFVPFVDVYAHIGGVIGGLLAGFVTISKWQAFTKITPYDKYRYPHLRSNSKLRVPPHGQETLPTCGKALKQSRSSSTAMEDLNDCTGLDIGDGIKVTNDYKERVVSHSDNTRVSRSIESDSDSCFVPKATPSPQFKVNYGSDNERNSRVVKKDGWVKEGDSSGYGNGGSGEDDSHRSPHDGRLGDDENDGSGREVSRNGAADASGLSESECGPGKACEMNVAVAESGVFNRRHRDGDQILAPSRKGSIVKRSQTYSGGEDGVKQRTPSNVDRSVDRGRRRSFRATLDPVNDHCGCTTKIWGVRILALVILVSVWIPLFYYIFVCPDCYEAPGQLVQLGGDESSRSLTGRSPGATTGRWGGGKYGRLMATVARDSSSNRRLAYRYYEQQLRRQLLILKEVM